MTAAALAEGLFWGALGVSSAVAAWSLIRIARALLVARRAVRKARAQAEARWDHWGRG